MTLELQHEFSVLGLTRQLLVMTYARAGCVWSSAFGEWCFLEDQLIWEE